MNDNKSTVIEFSTKAVMQTDEAAHYLGLAAQTLCKWRCSGGGPRFIRLGRKVVYRIKDLDAFLESRVCESTTDADHRFGGARDAMARQAKAA